LPPSEAPAGPAPPGRPVCAPGGDDHFIETQAAHATELEAKWAMRIPRRRWLFTIWLIAVVAGLGYFGAVIASRLELGIGEPRTPEPALDQYRRTEELERRRQLILRRYLVKEQAVRELLAGRLTLLQAAARFRNAEMAVPVDWGPPRPDGSGPAERERLCRNVRVWARHWLEEHQPEKVVEVTARLEAELQQHRAEYGVVELPN
jgi:hypothetical protein